MPKLTALAILFLMAPASTKEKDKHTAHFDGLILTVTAIESVDERGGRPYAPAKPSDPRVPPPRDRAEQRGDHHYVAVLLNIKNAGKNPACMSFASLLRTTFGLEYKGLLFHTLTGPDNVFPSVPRISEMLPGEESSGSYVFRVKNGVSPLELSLKPERKSIHCNESVTGNWGDALLPQQVNFDVYDLPAPSK